MNQAHSHRRNTILFKRPKWDDSEGFGLCLRQSPNLQEPERHDRQVQYFCRSRTLEPLNRLQMHNVTVAARQVEGDIADIQTVFVGE